jgi:hypothetical protein
METKPVPAYTPNWRLLAKLVPALALLAVVIPSSAFGQASRTWVSGVGDDANPCSRTAPCKTFAGAISKTANGGEINAMDPGGFGGVTINKSLTIDGSHTEAGVLVSGTNAIVVNAAPTDKVKLKGLDINGIGTGAQTSLTGVKVLSARTVQVRDSEIYRFKAGVTVAPTSALTRVVLSNNNIHDNGVGVVNAPGSNTIGSTVVTMRHNEVHDNVCGVGTISFGTNAVTPDGTNSCGGGAAASGINKPATVRAFHNAFFDNEKGLFVKGSLGLAEIAYNEITGNSGFGIQIVNGGIVRTFSPATNVVSGNGASDAPNDTIPMQ